MPAEPVAQPCEVCGVKTTRRCSSCVKAGINLFFCSREHQKLVWPAHKTACGPGKAHPFLVMPLTKDELTWAIGQLDKAANERGTTWRECLVEASLTREPAEVTLKQLADEDHFTSVRGLKIALLNWVRLKFSEEHDPSSPDAEHARRIAAGERSYFDPVMAAQARVGLIIGVSARHADAGANEGCVERDEATWFSLLQHKALLVNRLYQLTLFDEQSPELEAYLDEAKERLFEWIRAGAGNDNPKIRRALATLQGPEGDSGVLYESRRLPVFL